MFLSTRNINANDRCVSRSRECKQVNVRRPQSERRAVDCAAKKKRILLSTTTKGLVQRYLSTHLDSSSRLDPNRSYWRAPLSPRGSGTERGGAAGGDREGDGHLSPEWRPTGRGRAKEWASDARSGASAEGSHCSRLSRHWRAPATTRDPLITLRNNRSHRNRSSDYRLWTSELSLSVSKFTFFFIIIFAPRSELALCALCVMLLFCFCKDS